MEGGLEGGVPSRGGKIRTRDLSRLGELLNTQKNVHFSAPPGSGGSQEGGWGEGGTGGYTPIPPYPPPIPPIYSKYYLYMPQNGQKSGFVGGRAFLAKIGIFAPGGQISGPGGPPARGPSRGPARAPRARPPRAGGSGRGVRRGVRRG